MRCSSFQTLHVPYCGQMDSGHTHVDVGMPQSHRSTGAGAAGRAGVFDSIQTWHLRLYQCMSGRNIVDNLTS